MISFCFILDYIIKKKEVFISYIDKIERACVNNQNHQIIRIAREKTDHIDHSEHILNIVNNAA